jgi:DNA-binding NtrC family response regulator
MTEHTPGKQTDDAIETTLNPLLGTSPAITQLRTQIQRIAPYFRTAMLTGARHCGDHAVAALLHRLSPLADRPLVLLDATDAEMLLGESFPPAAITEAGMLFLTWPERLSRTAQLTLLRLLRQRKPLPPRVVIFAEHGLRPLVSTGNFSAELETSLAALRIALPTLRERSEDIPALLQNHLQHAGAQASLECPQLTQSLLDAARQHTWPGNLRDLRDAADALLQHETNLPLGADALTAILEAIPSGPPADRRATRLIRLDQLIQEHVRAVLLACNGNKLRAAEILGISRSTLYRMLDNPAAFSQLPMAG